MTGTKGQISEDTVDKITSRSTLMSTGSNKTWPLPRYCKLLMPFAKASQPDF